MTVTRTLSGKLRIHRGACAWRGAGLGQGSIPAQTWTAGLCVRESGAGGGRRHRGRRKGTLALDADNLFQQTFHQTVRQLNTSLMKLITKASPGALPLARQRSLRTPETA
ncbi:hypothetical protein E2C01_007936 [Portunus trituberculatus]|uniref:Uncharacterized protein n=1 Tax=Portunus trituberculatus TaxID=210409 RepID=A0A5B7D1R5_PORTR|nr:hypothetical protein [Portunus trituberculatus]